MSTTETVRAWATTNAGNATADAAISSSDSMAPASLDNVDRSIMTGVRKFVLDIGGSLVAGGSANALTVTTNCVLESGQITDGLRVLLKAISDNTNATVTFAPDGLTAANIKRADGSVLAVGSIKSGMYLDLVYNSGSSEWRCANIAPLQPAASILTVTSTPGLNLLASGSASGATLDLVLTSYTAYRGIKIVFYGLIPATTSVDLLMRFSTDGGSTYDASASDYSYANISLSDAAASSNKASTAASSILINGNFQVLNTATQGVNAEITILNQVSTAIWTRATWNLSVLGGTSTLNAVFGAGIRRAAQDTDAVRFLFSSGNISAGSYAVYGLV